MTGMPKTLNALIASHKCYPKMPTHSANSDLKIKTNQLILFYFI